MHGPIYLDEKAAAGLPTTEQSPPQPAPRRRNRASVFLWLACVVALLYWVVPPLVEAVHGFPSSDSAKPTVSCKQVDPLFPEVSSVKLLAMEAALASPAYLAISAERLSGAVKIPTQSFDDLGEIGVDKRWDAMYPFAEYLEKTFPLVHSQLKLETVNTHGLLYTWNGSDSSLKPTLLMAHQDTVPVLEATLDQWTHPPWSGLIDTEGGYVWGRGASDCKNQLTGILEAVEALLAADFVPKRTLLLSFGFDEEISGRQGAGHLSKFVLDRYGPDSVAVIVDEGSGISESWGVALAQPGVAEKGYTDVTIVLRMRGGHSSVPPDHTAIGILSELITKIEADQYETFLDSKNPYLGKLQCGAEHAPEFPKKIRKLLPKSVDEYKKKHKPDALALEAAKDSLAIRYLMQTSIATDIINGGVKVNALPERVSVTINHRVNIGEHPADVHKKITGLATGIAKKYDLTLNAFNKANETTGSLNLVQSRDTLEPAPVSPTSVVGVTPYGILSGTTRGIYTEKIIMSPGSSTGNTDTRYFWDLTRHIFRYGPAWAPGVSKGSEIGNGVHTVNERMSIAAHINGVKWFTSFIRNMDEAQL